MKLTKGDFIFSEEVSQGFINVEISASVDSVILFGKTIKDNSEIVIGVPADGKQYEDQLIEHIEWLGIIKKEFLDYYNNSDVPHKIENVSQQWYDALEITDLILEIYGDGSIITYIIIHDNFKDGFGFWVYLKNKTITGIEYDPIV